MEKKQIKRFLALIKAETELGRKFNLKLPKGFKKSFESQKYFRGWTNYHVTWDVSEKDAWTVVPLDKSLEQTWNEELEKIVPVITPNGEIVEAEEWAKKSASTETQK